MKKNILVIITVLYAVNTFSKSAILDFKNKPINKNNTFVCIIANGEYFKPNTNEYYNNSNVYNDGKLIKECCEKTLGINSNNILYYKDAKLEDVLHCIEYIKKTSNKYNGEINLIFFVVGIETGYIGYEYNKDIDTYSAVIVEMIDQREIENDSVFWLHDNDGNEVCYNLERLYNDLYEINAEEIICFIDIKRRDLYSGSEQISAWIKTNDSINPPKSTIYIKQKEIDKTIQQKETKGKSIVVFMSTQTKPYTYSYDYGLIGDHGLFYHYLIKKITQSKGNITIGDLYEYVSTNVENSAKEFKGTQTPTVITYPDKNYNWKNLKLRNW